MFVNSRNLMKKFARNLMRRLPAEGEWFKNVEENLENANVTLPRPLVWAHHSRESYPYDIM